MYIVVHKTPFFLQSIKSILRTFDAAVAAVVAWGSPRLVPPPNNHAPRSRT